MAGGGRSLGRRFGWLWAAYAVSTFGTRLAFDAFPLIAVVVLHAGATEVALLAASGLAVGAVVAVPLGAWVEFRRKRPVMIAADLVRCAALLSVPAAFALDELGLGQLLVVSVVVAAADITFGAASGAYLKSLVPPEDLLVANGRFEATTWTATALGPPLGGVAIGVFGPMTTVLADAASYLLSALGIRAIGGKERQQTGSRQAERHPAERQATDRQATDRQSPPPAAPAGLRMSDLPAGWQHILTHPTLRPLFLNTLLVNALIMAPAPLLAVLMLGQLGFAPWQYGLAFAVPCLGGLLGSRLSRRLVARHGRHRVLLTVGTLRACWPVGLAFVGPGTPGLLLVMAVEFGLITCMGVFTPVLATTRLDRTPPDRTTRTLSAWSITSRTTTATMTALWGLLASQTGPRTAIALAGVLLLATPLLLPRHEQVAQHSGAT
ncbi:major facilitator transporter [Streptomyces viridochromogenes]|uniref:Major facilitator transporter n=1 Tax=Streptomyces viridochromogenes TaxID=1938 RepID=A0A0J7Z1B9_STRVR|nr:MFS transporter [Streptomyces viridochromogenes]KMS69412.1 major facilitator transporter [Streptomyces viridochromogenes]